MIGTQLELPERELNIKIPSQIWMDSSYSGKFSLVQNFMELPPNPSEAIFVVLNFMPASALWWDHTHHQPVSGIALANGHGATLKFLWFLFFAAANLYVKTTKFCTLWKFPASNLYTYVHTYKKAHSHYSFWHGLTVMGRTCIYCT